MRKNVENYIYKNFEVATGSFWSPFHPKTARPYRADSSLETASISNNLIEFVLFPVNGSFSFCANNFVIVGLIVTYFSLKITGNSISTFEVAPKLFPFNQKMLGFMEPILVEKLLDIPNDLIEFVLFCLLCILKPLRVL